MASLTNLTDACKGCPGRCCTRRFWDTVHLTRNESRDPRFKGMLGINAEGDPVLVMGKTACHFLDRKTGRCLIYKSRPMACRGYVCHTAGGRSTEVIHEFPALRRHLYRQGLVPAPLRPQAFFYLDGAPTSVRHLRELRGSKSADVARYNGSRDRHEIVGRFDPKGKFHRIQL